MNLLRVYYPVGEKKELVNFKHPLSQQEAVNLNYNLKVSNDLMKGFMNKCHNAGLSVVCASG